MLQSFTLILLYQGSPNYGLRVKSGPGCYSSGLSFFKLRNAGQI